MGWPYWLRSIGLDDPPLWMRANSARFSWLVVLSPELAATARRDLPVRAAWRVARLALFLVAIGFIGAAADDADGAGAAGAVAAGARGAEGADGVTGALVCAQTGAAIASTAAIATPFKRCFMPLSSVAVPDWTNTLKGSLNPRVALPGLGPETTRVVFRSREHATWGVTYPTSPAADNMTEAREFQALGWF
jgi:hypothetical protein